MSKPYPLAPPKIVHSITKLEFGGAQQNTLYTLRHLPADFNGYLLCGRGGLLDDESVKSDAFKRRFCPLLKRRINPLFDFLAFCWMFFYFLGLKPDVLHSHSSKAGIISRWAGRLSGIPVIIHTFHGFGFTPLQRNFERNFFVLMERITARITSSLIFVAKANLEKARSLRIGRQEQYLLIRSGIDFKKFEKKSKITNIKKSIGLKDSDKLIGNISCFKLQKGLYDFVEVCRRLMRKGNYYFLLVGDGELRKSIQKQVAKAGLKERFFMPGWKKNIEDVLSSLDVMLHTSYFEGLPRVFLESMASGVPVVATNVDGATDIITDGVNGYLVSPGDISTFVEKTYNLLENDRLREDMAQAGFKRLNSSFSIQVMSEQLNDLYRKCLKRRF